MVQWELSILARSTSTALHSRHLALPARIINPCIPLLHRNHNHNRPGVSRSWSSCPRHEAKLPIHESRAQVTGNPKLGLKTLIEDDKLYYTHSRSNRTFLDTWNIAFPSERAAWTELALRALRDRLFRTYRRNASLAAKATVDNQWWKILQDIDVIAKQQVDLNNPDLIRDAFYFGGLADLAPQNHNAYQDRGRFSLEVAFHLGHGQAPIVLARHELAMASQRNPYRRSPTQAAEAEPVDLPAAIVDYLREVALCRRNWEAMTAYLDYILRRRCGPKVVRENFELARDLSLMVSPSQSSSELKPALERIEPPWYLLQKAADQFVATFSKSGSPEELKEARELAAGAISSGVSEWEDMRAIEEDLKSEERPLVGSDKWLTYTTHKAMAGDDKACFALGDYYIRKEGWHPHTRQQSAPKTRMGLWWLEASASAVLDQPELCARRHLLIALLLDENGLHGEGASVLARGVDVLADSAAPAGEVVTQWLKSYATVWPDIANWHTSPQIGKDWSATDKSMNLLDREEFYREVKI
ncbi:hypothetical protein PV10_07507 [Exophiala mesophila]|uniref:Uncharacterized protein n=1 Tax=Exophiala mesophila TaxID=212818 RepID=A0A0D1XPZ2_EXOME|nr:uncharacterized protein PV10_07507 [Exophiala mesophila]KIV90176.1 hypothetical protein PV10_07507 [Exophiala mesophila]